MKMKFSGMFPYLLVMLMVILVIRVYIDNEQLTAQSFILKREALQHKQTKEALIGKFNRFSRQISALKYNQEELESLRSTLQEDTLYLRIPSNFCPDCLVNELEYLKTKFQNQPKKISPILLTSIIGSRQLKIIERETHPFQVKNMETFNTLLDKLETPYYMIKVNGALFISYVVKEVPFVSHDFIDDYLKNQVHE
ncbi:MAG: hypothetical protein R6U66_11600 [Bacteroidales bacterium]